MTRPPNKQSQPRKPDPQPQPQPDAQLPSKVEFHPEVGREVEGLATMGAMALAQAHPRDENRVLAGALNEIDIYPENAAKSYYVIPFKSKGEIIHVEGPSIRLAMALARRWGNCSNGARILSQDDERIVVEGAFVDWETGFRTLRLWPVSRFWVSKDTKQLMPYPEDTLIRQINAGVSKAVRNAILSSLPPGLVEQTYKRCKDIVSGKVVPKGATTSAGTQGAATDQAYAKMGAAFITIGITKGTLELYIAEVVIPYLTEQHPEKKPDKSDVVAHMRGIFTAIEDGQTKVNDVFGEYQKQMDATKPTGAGGDYKQEDLKV